MEARGKRAAFSTVRWARSVRPRRRQLPQGPSVCDKIAASSDCSRLVNDYVHIEASDLRRPNARFTTERQGYQVLTPFGKLGYSQKNDRPERKSRGWLTRQASDCCISLGKMAQRLLPLNTSPKKVQIAGGVAGACESFQDRFQHDQALKRSSPARSAGDGVARRRVGAAISGYVGNVGIPSGAHVRTQRFQTALILARRNADEHLFDDAAG